MFSCIARVIFYTYDDLYDSEENYAGYNFQSFSQSFYSMIVVVSTTNFPMALAKAMQYSYWFSTIFFVLTTFVLNFILLNLIMAVFFFYYQNFYTQNIKQMVAKKNLFKKLYCEMEKHNNNIPNSLLKAIIYAYCENPETNFTEVDELQVVVQLAKDDASEPDEMAVDYSTKVDLIKRWSFFVSREEFQFAIGVIDVLIFCLVLPSIDSFS